MTTTTTDPATRPVTGTTPPPTTRPPSPPVRWVARLATWRVWTLSAAVYTAYAGAFFATTASFAIPHVRALCGQPPLDMRTTSSAADVNGFLEACGTAGREAYRALQLADLAYPLVFAVFLASSLAMVLSRLLPDRPGVLALALLPFLASAFDYTENVFAWRALMAFPGATTTDGLLGLASAAKTFTSWAAGGLLVVGVLALLLRAALRRAARARASRNAVHDGSAR